MKKTMFLRDVLQEMRKLDHKKNPVPFSISYRTYNRQNKMGGRLVTYHNATLLQAPKTPGSVRLSQDIDFKNPNHYENKTQNIKTDQGIKKLSILFITEFNNHKVVL